MRAWRRASFVVSLAFLAACSSIDPQKELRISDLETYWAIDSAVGTTQYIAPVVRFRLTSIGSAPAKVIEATVAFQRRGEENVTWGTDWQRVSTSSKPLAPGESVLVMLKSDARYFSQGPLEGMFAHGEFKDARAVVFLRIGSSLWSKFAEVDVERRIGSRGVTSVTP